MVSVHNYLSEDAGLIQENSKAFLPPIALVPLKKNDSSDFEILVKGNEIVKEGQVIARSLETAIHASIPGKVLDIIETDFADGSRGLAAKIKLEGAFSFTGKKNKLFDWKALDQKTLLYIFSEKGVYNTFSKLTCLSSQIKKIEAKASRLLIVRLYSDDPSRLTEGLVSKFYFEMVKQGSFIIAKAMSANGILFVADTNDKDKDFSYSDSDIPYEKIFIDSTAYPNGFMHEIIQATKKTCKDSPFNKISTEDLYIDCLTALNAFNAVCFNEPVISSKVHLSGDCLNTAGFFDVKIGTTLKDLVAQAGGFKRPLSKIVINGILLGLSVSNLNIPVSKEVKSVAFIPKENLPDQIEQVCVRCGECLKICPVSLFPESLYRSYIHKESYENNLALIRQTAALCTECALCNSVCPSRIPLSQIIAKLKTEKTYEK